MVGNRASLAESWHGLYVGHTITQHYQQFDYQHLRQVETIKKCKSGIRFPDTKCILWRRRWWGRARLTAYIVGYVLDERTEIFYDFVFFILRHILLTQQVANYRTEVLRGDAGIGCTLIVCFDNCLEIVDQFGRKL